MAQTRVGSWSCGQAARCIAPVPVGEDGTHHRFMVGTYTLQQRNEIHVLEFEENTADVVCRRTLPHEDEIWLLSVSPTNSSQVATYSSGKASSPALRLWNTGNLNDPQASMEEVCTLEDEETPLTSVKSVLWDPHNEGIVVVADTEALRVFQGSSGVGSKLSRQLTLHVGQRCNGACLDPHHPQHVSTVDDAHLKTWDLRSSRLASKKEYAHLFGARDVDYNPNVPYQVLTTGEDAVIRFWDLRQLGKCMRTLANGHHHWITCARFNSHHDQLVLSCGTDSFVCLWRAGCEASPPLGGGGAGGVEDGPGCASESQLAPDGLIQRFEEHEDSCYSCCWSAADAWIFASVSYDGKVVINRVPGEEKLRIQPN
mmetsp:Transcript_93659/g.180741  ORF Transcript_93659/g.180741 Transcript_93659/m.180741 type:complete len:370 (+) Transcript_93659:59-1168(+)